MSINVKYLVAYTRLISVVLNSVLLKKQPLLKLKPSLLNSKKRK